jgi:hypothetical protein
LLAKERAHIADELASPLILDSPPTSSVDEP